MMSQSQDIKPPHPGASVTVAPTPQNTPLDNAVLTSRPADLGKPTVEDIGEGEEEGDGEDVSAMNPASLLARVSRSFSAHIQNASFFGSSARNPVGVEISDAQNPALLALAQHKFDKLIGRSSGYIESLPAPVRRRIDGLKGIQVEHGKIETEFQLAILDLERKVSWLEPMYSSSAARR